jgi:hypothetical protein
VNILSSCCVSLKVLSCRAPGGSQPTATTTRHEGRGEGHIYDGQKHGEDGEGHNLS